MSLKGDSFCQQPIAANTRLHAQLNGTNEKASVSS
jgi:hypothetical protein